LQINYDKKEIPWHQIHSYLLPFPYQSKSIMFDIFYNTLYV
jgi:hypothetical protein